MFSMTKSVDKMFKMTQSKQMIQIAIQNGVAGSVLKTS